MNTMFYADCILEHKSNTTGKDFGGKTEMWIKALELQLYDTKVNTNINKHTLVV